MDRRGFLKLVSGAVADIALEEAIPFNRIWSFPRKIVIPKLSLDDFRLIYLEPAARQLKNEMDARLFNGTIGYCYGFDWADEVDRTDLTVVTLRPVPITTVDLLRS